MCFIRGRHLLLLITNLFADANFLFFFHHCAIWASVILFLCRQCSAVDAQLLYLFFRLTCSCCPAANLTDSVTSRQPSWTGQKTHHISYHQLIDNLQKQRDATSKSLCAVLSCRETNMKVRQSVSVTSELGGPNNLALFDGEFKKKIILFIFLS